MRLLEYKAAELFEAAGIPTAGSAVVQRADEVAGAVQQAGLRFPLVVKAQVPVGGRGKAGGVQPAADVEEARRQCEKMLENEIKGCPVRRVMLAQQVAHNAEWYLSILLDRVAKCPVAIFSAKGGVDIEETAKQQPQAVLRVPIDPAVGVRGYMARYMLSAAGLAAEWLDELLALLKKLYDVFMKNDCLLCEINPVAVVAAEPDAPGTPGEAAQKGRLLALDGKIEVDDDALHRHPALLEYRDAMEENPLVLQAREHNFLYIPVADSGNIAVASNGSGMLMSCIDLISKEGMQVKAVLDLGGGATAQRICQALRILYATPGVDTVLVNIFGGITRCDEVAGGIAMAMPALPGGEKLIVRMEGTNKEEGMAILAKAEGDITSVDGLRESVAALLSLAERGAAR